MGLYDSYSEVRASPENVCRATGSRCCEPFQGLVCKPRIYGQSPEQMEESENLTTVPEAQRADKEKENSICPDRPGEKGE